MAATDQPPEPYRALAPREPSIHGPSPPRTARTIWAMLTKKEDYREPAQAVAA